MSLSKGPHLLTLIIGVSLFLLGERRLSAQEASSKAHGTKSSVELDRAVVSFSAPEGGGRDRPYFIYGRELAFESRLVALADSAHRSRSVPYRRHHLQTALERHVAETLLSALTIDPKPSSRTITQQLAVARAMLVEQIGGEAELLSAARAEGLGRLELRRYFRRKALASLYLDAMVAPMLEPSLLELRRTHRRGEGPLASRPFSEAESALRRWVVARSLQAALTRYFQNARARVRLQFL